MKLEGGLKGGFTKDEPVAMMKKRFEIRELIMLQKLRHPWIARIRYAARCPYSGGTE